MGVIIVLTYLTWLQQRLKDLIKCSEHAPNVVVLLLCLLLLEKQYCLGHIFSAGGILPPRGQKLILENGGSFPFLCIEQNTDIYMSVSVYIYTHTHTLHRQIHGESTALNFHGGR